MFSSAEIGTSQSLSPSHSLGPISEHMSNEDEVDTSHKNSDGLLGDLFVELPIEAPIQKNKNRPTVRTYSMITRSKASSNPTAMISTSSFEEKEPNNVHDALEKPQWVAAMKEELEALAAKKEELEALHRNET